MKLPPPIIPPPQRGITLPQLMALRTAQIILAALLGFALVAGAVILRTLTR